LGAAVVLGVAIVAWNVISSAVDETARGPVPLAYGSPEELVRLAQGVTTGNPDAPIRIMEFGDYQCPSCRQFFSATKPFIDMSYVQAGNVSFTFHDFPLYEAGHNNAFLAARAARCAGDQGQYWGFHDRLFQNQAQWSLRPDPSGDFIDYAGELGLDGATFRACLASDAHAEVVTANRLLGEQLGVQGTPTIIVDTGEGRAIRVDDYSIDNLRRIIDGALPSAPVAAGAAVGGGNP
jgi:protein-disulfide isomerase